MCSVIVPLGRPIFLPLSWATVLMSELLATTMWLVPQKYELMAMTEAGTPLSRPITNGVGAVWLTSMAPAIMASRPSLPSTKRRHSTSSPSCLKKPCRMAITSAAPRVEVCTASRSFIGAWEVAGVAMAMMTTRSPSTVSGFLRMVGGL